MSGFALAYDSHGDRRRPISRRGARRTAPLRLVEVPLVNVSQLRSPAGTGIPAYVWWLAALAVALHGAVVWYATHHKAPPAVRQSHQVAVEFISPPKPPPKVEPPKPAPPKAEVKKQVLPQIQTAIPDTPTVADASDAAPIAVAPVAPPAPEPAPESEPVSAPFGGAGYLNNPPPAYPPAAARQGWEGTVVLRVKVLSTGKVDIVEVQKSSGKKLLDEAAKTTVLAWVFTPSKRGATPVDGWASVPIEFKLDT